MQQQAPSPTENKKPRRFQFTLLRLLACTTFVALAAWVASANLPVAVFLSYAGSAGAGKWNIFPILACCMLLGAAVGVLIQGETGALEGARVGCLLPCLVLSVVTMFMMLTALFSFFAWLTGAWGS
jgi:hypothetical protein